MTDPSYDRASRTAQMAAEWSRAQPMIAAFIRSVIPDFHTAEDVLQQTAFVVFEKLDEYDESRPFVTWAISIARYTSMHSLRSYSRDRHVFDSNEIERIANAFSAFQGEAGPMAEALDYCIKKVEGRHRQLLTLKYQKNLSARQIGQQLNMRENAVFTMLSRIRSALRNCIERRIADGGQS